MLFRKWSFSKNQQRYQVLRLLAEFRKCMFLKTNTFRKSNENYLDSQCFCNKKVFVFPMIWTISKKCMFLKQTFPDPRSKSTGNPNGFETGNVTWCNSFCMVFKKAMFLKSIVSLNPLKVQFWIFWESQESICISNVSVNSRGQGFKLPKRKSTCISNGFEWFSKKTTF